MTESSIACSAPIFIAGPPRCGTTLCARLLGQVPGIHAPGETHFMEDIYARMEEFGDLSQLENRQLLVSRLETIYDRFNEPEDQERVQALMSVDDIRREIVDAATDWKSTYVAFMDRQVQFVGARRWLNHTPKDIFYVEELIRAFPDAKFLLCIRDPRDFLLSYKNKWKATNRRNSHRIKSLYNPIVTSLLWRASARRINDLSSNLPKDRILVIPYEELTTSPRSTVSRIIDFVGEEFRQEYLDFEFSNSSYDSAPRKISDASVGRWRGNLQSREVWWVEKLTAEQMATFGYSLSRPQVRIVEILFDLLKLPANVFQSLWANRNNRGPLLPYVVRRLRGLTK
jgi:hypothetical protein